MRSLALLVGAFLLYCLACGLWLKRFAPDPGVSDYAGLKNQGVPLTSARRLSTPPDHICVFGNVQSVSWTIPSGPPAYLFDPSGRLIDYTLDVGDSPKFQSDYGVYTGHKVPLATVERQFGVSP